MPSGRPSKLTPERQAGLVQAISEGHYYETACAAVGVDYSTMRRWMQRGAEEPSGEYREFFEALTRAEAEAESRAVRIWQAAMETDWRAAQMFLERRHPDRWGKQSRLDVNGSTQLQVQHAVETVSANALLAALGLDPLGTTLPTMREDESE